jgi:cystathionine beta-lyase
MSDSQNQSPARSILTRLSHLGRPSGDDRIFVNQPVVRASTILYDSVADLHSKKARYSYGRRGTPTSEALETAISDLEGAAGTVLTPSGLAAVSLALMSALSAGDHVLVVDCIYEPGRHFCDTTLKRFGVTTTYFDPRIGAGIADLFKENTRAVYLESPGSETFEIADLRAISTVAHARDALVIVDNTWATPVFHRPLELGADISLMAATKYIVGHSDALIGTVAANERAWPMVKATHGNLGIFTGPDDMYLALRGLRTLGVRLQQHEASAIKIARWLETRPEVSQVLYPALESHPDHALWKRDFDGAVGLIGVVLKPASKVAVASFIDGLSYFGIGYSWGGYESLAIPTHPATHRTATKWEAAGPSIRLQIGLEDADDLIADLTAGFARLSAHG